MKTLKDVEISAYIKQCEMEGNKVSYKDLNETEIDTAQRRNGRYFQDLTNWLGIKNLNEVIKNGKGNYEFTDEGALLLEDVFCLWYLKNKKTKRSYTQKALVRQIIDYEQNDIILDKSYLKVLEVMCSGNDMVIKVFECFYKLLSDAGLSKEAVENLLHGAAIRKKYAERRIFNGVFTVFKEYIERLNLIYEDMHEELLSGTEAVIWTDYAVQKIKETMDETISVKDRMSDIRLCELELEAGFAYNLNAAESIEAYMVQEVKIIELCKENQEISRLLHNYETLSGVKLELEAVVPRVMSTHQTILKDDERKEYDNLSEQNNHDMELARLEWLLSSFKEDNGRLKKAIVNSKEKILKQLIAHIEKIFAEHMQSTLTGVSKDKLTHNEALLEKAVCEIEEARELLYKLQNRK